MVTAIAAPNPSLNEGSITLLLVNNNQQLTVQTNSRSQFEDKTDTVDPMRLADIVPGDYLEIRGFVDDGGAVIATEVRRDGVNGDDLSGEDVVLQGPVSSASEPLITILGITFSTDGSTEFEGLLDQTLNSSTFYGALSIGTLVKLKDDNVPGDGIVDEASLED